MIVALIGRKMRGTRSRLRSSSEESTGVSVSALKSEIVIAQAIVTANCL